MSEDLWGDIQQAIGPTAVAGLVAAFGGGRLYVPEVLAPGSEIEKAIGAQAAAALSRVGGGTRLSIPRVVPTRLRTERDAQVRAQRAQNWTVPEIASHHGITERTVYLILARTEAQP